MSYSEHAFIGRLTKDPDIREVSIKGEATKVANFTVACDRKVGNEADFYNVVAWRQLAATVERYLSSGRLVLVKGRPQNRRYDVTKDGVTFTQNVTEIIAEEIQFLDKPSDNQQSSGSAGYQNQNVIPAGEVPPF